MKVNFKLSWMIAFIFLVLPIASGLSVTLDLPDSIIEEEIMDLNIIIESQNSFNGVIDFTFTNIASSTNTIVISNLSFIGKYHNSTITVAGTNQGEYSINGNLKDHNLNPILNINKNGYVNSTLPKVISVKPNGFIDKETVLLSAMTNEDSTCRYGSENETYDEMDDEFYNTGKKSHNETVTFDSQGRHRYYVLCKDKDGNKMVNPAVIEFTIDLPPTAEIILSEDNPVKEGVIDVEVKTSEDIEGIPELYYVFDDQPSSKNYISLKGSGSEWEGFLVITEEDDNRVGSFHFSGEDRMGNKGGKITSGNLFVVDTTKPPAPENIKAVQLSNGDVRLNWYYDGEEVDYYKIYRSTLSGVNYVDYYMDANESEHFYDTSTTNKVTYYYKVSAIDIAGNEGPLSSEVYATAVDKYSNDYEEEEETTDSEDEESKVLPPDLVPVVETAIKRIDKLIIDVKDILSIIESKTDKELLEQFNVKTELDTAKTKLYDLKDRLEAMKSKYMTINELENKIKEVDMEAQKIEKTVPKSVNMIGSTQFLQSNSKEEIESAVELVFANLDITDEEKNEYIKINNKKKDKMKVDVTGKVISIEYLDGTIKEKSFIEKKLSYEDPEVLQDVIVIETIPKEVAETVDEITFTENNYEIIERRDTILKYGFHEFNYEGEIISYSLDKKIDFEGLKKSKSTILLSPAAIEFNSAQVTGASVFSFPNLGLSGFQIFFTWAGLIVIFGLLGYYLFIVKDYGTSIKNIPRNIRLKRIESIGKGDNKSSQKGFDDVKVEKVSLNGATEETEKPEQGESNISYKKNLAYIRDLVLKANNHLDNNDVEMAVKLYPQISFSYQTLPREFRQEFYNACINLHRRINQTK